jgi:hypothetical protein
VVQQPVREVERLRIEPPQRFAGGPFDARRLSLRLIADHGSLELFAQGGATAQTLLVFPTSAERRLALSTRSDATPRVEAITLRALAAATSVGASNAAGDRHTTATPGDPRGA